MWQPKLAYAIWSWGVKTPEQMVTGMRDVRDAGFRYFESISAAVEMFRGTLDELKAIVDREQVFPVSFYFHQSGNLAQDVQRVRSAVDFLTAFEVKTITVQAMMKKGGGATQEELDLTVRTIEETAKVVNPCGIFPCLHPHTNTLVMYENEIDYILQRTDPHCVGFAPDTAHLLAGNCDPVAVIRRYADRVKFVHLKDVKKGKKLETVKGAEMEVEVFSDFLELGAGDVDLVGCLRVLKGAGYDGYLCVELDRPPRSHRESAFANKAYLDRTLPKI
mgnify:CR=1 FL=1